MRERVSVRARQSQTMDDEREGEREKCVCVREGERDREKCNNVERKLRDRERARERQSET